MDNIVWRLWRCRFVDWLFLGFVGVFGAILLIWGSRVVRKVVEVMGHFSVLQVSECGDQRNWMFSGVYGPQLASDHRLMWDEIGRAHV